MTSYLWNIWNELGVSEGLVVSHVGVEPGCVHQEGLNTTQMCLFLHYCASQRGCNGAERRPSPAHLVLLGTQSGCRGDLFQLRGRLLPEDPLQQDKDIRRLRRGLQQHCQTTVPETICVYVSNDVPSNLSF